METEFTADEWIAARRALLDQLDNLERDCPVVVLPWGTTPVGGNVYFRAPEQDYYQIDNPRPVVFYRRARVPYGWPGDKWYHITLEWRSGQLEIGRWHSPLKLPVGWRNAVVAAYELRDEVRHE